MLRILSRLCRGKLNKPRVAQRCLPWRSGVRSEACCIICGHISGARGDAKPLPSTHQHNTVALSVLVTPCLSMDPRADSAAAAGFGSGSAAAPPTPCMPLGVPGSMHCFGTLRCSTWGGHTSQQGYMRSCHNALVKSMPQKAFAVHEAVFSAAMPTAGGLVPLQLRSYLTKIISVDDMAVTRELTKPVAQQQACKSADYVTTHVYHKAH